MKKFNLKAILALALCLAMLPLYGLQAFAAEGDITAIYISGADAIDFKADTLNYQINVPYFNGEYKMPVVYPVGGSATVTYPDEVKDGAEIIVEGYRQIYTLIIKTVGENMYTNGSFELTGPVGDDWNYGWSGQALYMFARNNPYDGQYSAIQGNSVAYSMIYPSESDGHKVVLKPGATYIAGFASRLATPADIKSTIYGFMLKNEKTWTSERYSDRVCIEPKQDTNEAVADDTTSSVLYNADGTIMKSGKGRFYYEDEMDNEWTYYPAVIKPGDVNIKLQYYMWRSGSNGIQTAYMYDAYYAGELLAARVNINNKNGQSRLVAAPGTSLELTAEVLNQTGNKAGLENAAGTWSIAGNDKVTIDENGKVTVASDAAGKALAVYTVTPNVENSKQGKVCGVKEITVGEASTDCTLKALKVGNFFVEGVSADKTEYTAYVPYKYTANDFRTVAMPNVTAWTADGASYEVTYPKTVRNGVVKLTVTNGDFSKDYFITLEVVGDNYYLNGNMEEEKYWTNHGQGENGMSYTDDAAAGNRAVNLSVTNAYTLTLKQDNGNTALKPTVPGYDYLFTALYKVSDNCYIYAGDRSCDNKTIKYYKVTDDNIASENPGGSKRDGTDDCYSATIDRYQRTIGIMREKDNETRYLDTSCSVSRIPRELYMDEVYASELTVASIGLTEGAEVTLDGTGKEVNLAAEAKNAYGNTAGMEYAAYSYELFGNYDGVSIADGKLVVSPEAKPGTVNVKITCTPNFKSIQCPTGVEPISTLAQIKLTEQITVSNAKITYTANENGITAALSGANTTDLTSFAVITAVYTVANGETVLEKAYVKNIDCAKGGQFNYTETVNAAQGQKIKTFVLGNLNNITPVRINGEYTV